jgi:hypothetical protein
MHGWLIALLFLSFPWDNSNWNPPRQQELVDFENIRQVCLPQFRAYAPNLVSRDIGTVVGQEQSLEQIRADSTAIEPGLLRAMSDGEIAEARRNLRELSFLPMGPGTSGYGKNAQVIADMLDCAFKQRLCQVGRTKYCGGGSAPSVASAARPNVAAKPALVAVAKKLPPARPAKMAPWSPRAMPTDPTKALSSKYAAERADAFASCSVPFNEMMKRYPNASRDEAVFNFEQELLNDNFLNLTPDQIATKLTNLETWIVTQADPGRLSAERLGKCFLQRRLAQLEGSPLISGAVDGTLTPLIVGSDSSSWKQQGKDARIIASNGKSAMDCVKLEQLASGDSKVGVGGRRLYNSCSDEVEITWCNTPGCSTPTGGNAWTVQPGYGWPVSAEGEVRWAACHGRDTAAFVKGSYGLRYYCTAPLKK